MRAPRLALARLLTACALAGASVASAQQAQEGPVERVAHLRIEGALDAGTRSHLRRAVESAQELAAGGRARLIVELDTPGGNVELMWSLANQLDEAAAQGIDVAAWVHHRAYSAGALLAMACDPLYVSPQAAIGAAAPVQAGPAGMQAIEDETVRAKMVGALRSSFRGWAERHDRPAALAEAMVDTGVGVKLVRVDGEPRLLTQQEFDDARARGELLEVVSTVVPVGELLALSGQQSVELGLADGVVESLEEVAERMGVAGAQVETVRRTRSDDWAAMLDSIKYLLLVLAVMGAFAEIKTPGFGVPGIGAIVCVALFLFGRYLIGLADALHIVAVVAGIILIAVELFVMPGTIWVGLLGGLLAIGGLLASTVVPSGSLVAPLDRSMAVDEAFNAMLGLFAACAGAWALSRVLPKTPIVSRMVLATDGGSLSGAALAEGASLDEKRRLLVGVAGVALTDLRPVGKVTLSEAHGEDFEARSAGAAIDRGARVRVVDVSSGRLVVEPMAQEQRT